MAGDEVQAGAERQTELGGDRVGRTGDGGAVPDGEVDEPDPDPLDVPRVHRVGVAQVADRVERGVHGADRGVEPEDRVQHLPTLPGEVWDVCPFGAAEQPEYAPVALEYGSRAGQTELGELRGLGAGAGCGAGV